VPHYYLVLGEPHDGVFLLASWIKQSDGFVHTIFKFDTMGYDSLGSFDHANMVEVT
jgi:hypothetical protein